mgnify:FL=1
MTTETTACAGSNDNITHRVQDGQIVAAAAASRGGSPMSQLLPSNTDETPARLIVPSNKKSTAIADLGGIPSAAAIA